VGRAIRRGFPHAVVTEVTSAERLRAAMDAGRFDLVLTEHWLPWTSGLEVLARMRRRHPDCPVIIITGSGDEAVAVRAMKSGAVDYLTKAPEDLAKVPAAIEAALARRTTQQVRATAGGDASQALEALQLQTAAVTAAANGIVITSLDGTVQWVNPAFTRMTGYAPHDVIGQKPAMLKSGRHDDAFYRELWQTILAGDVWHGEVVNRRKDGRLYTEQMTITPVETAGAGITHFVAIKSDITREKELQAQLRQAQKMEAVGQLAGGVAHDFNNMLTAILGYCELLLDSTPPEDARHPDILEIRATGDRAAALTRQLLAFSRRQILAPRAADLNRVVRDLEGLLRRVLSDEVTLVTALAREPVIAHIDIGHLEQTLVNLAVNASDAMPEGGTLRISTGIEDIDGAFVGRHPGAREGRFACLRVSDTGTGMTPEVQAHMFEPFYTTKPQGKGTGLGLSTVYGFIKQSQGYIWAKSAPGQGTTFTLHLPLGEADARTEASASRPARGRRAPVVVEGAAARTAIGPAALAGRVQQVHARRSGGSS
jgi:two-component system, cell cycle sensor histidine kinase and response regulator CckA